MSSKPSSALIPPLKDQAGGSHSSAIVIPSAKAHDDAYDLLPVTPCHLANPSWSCSHPTLKILTHPF